MSETDVKNLPADGDMIEFNIAPDDGPFKVGARYRVEHKDGSREYLLIDVLSGHAVRLMGDELGYAEWVRIDPPDVSRETAAKEAGEAGAASSGSQQQEASSSAKPLSSLPFAEEAHAVRGAEGGVLDDEEEVEEEEEDPHTRVRTKVKKKVKKKK